jgi:hypothetical protein
MHSIFVLPLARTSSFSSDALFCFATDIRSAVLKAKLFQERELLRSAAAGSHRAHVDCLALDIESCVHHLPMCFQAVIMPYELLSFPL